MYILLFLFWILLCGKVTAEILLIGLCITAAMVVVEKALFGYTPKTEWTLLKKSPLMLAYIGILVWEILKAACGVARFTLMKEHKAVPSLVTFRADLKTDFGRFLLANSITLTPGTITIRVEGDRFTVHCLDRGMLDISPDGVFQRWIRKLED